MLPVSACLHHRWLAVASRLGLQLRGIAMHTERLERMAPATFFLAACVGFFGVYAAAEYAHAQAIPPTRAQGTNLPLSAPQPWLDRVPSMPAPIFNPSSPYTVPQAREPFRRQARGRYLAQVRATGLNELSDEYGWRVAVAPCSSVEQVLRHRGDVISAAP
jgi:hypothetical protein